MQFPVHFCLKKNRRANSLDQGIPSTHGKHIKAPQLLEVLEYPHLFKCVLEGRGWFLSHISVHAFDPIFGSIMPQVLFVDFFYTAWKDAFIVFLSLPVQVHGGLICTTFCLSVTKIQTRKKLISRKLCIHIKLCRTPCCLRKSRWAHNNV